MRYPKVVHKPPRIRWRNTIMEMKTLQIVFSDDKIYNVSLTDENGKVNQLLSGLLQIGQAAAIPSPAEACPEDESVSNNLTLLLNHLGLSPNLKGYYYIKHAVLQVMKDPRRLSHTHRQRGTLYPPCYTDCLEKRAQGAVLPADPQHYKRQANQQSVHWNPG